MPPDCNNRSSAVTPEYPPSAKNGVPPDVGDKVRPLPSEFMKKLIYLDAFSPNLNGTLLVPPLAKVPRPIFVPEFVEVLFVNIPYVITPVFAFAPWTLTFTPYLVLVAVFPDTAISKSLPVVSELLAIYAPVPEVNELAVNTNPEDVVALDVLLELILAPLPTYNEPDEPMPPVTIKAPDVLELAFVLFNTLVMPETCKVDLRIVASVTPKPPEMLTLLLTPTAEVKLVAPVTFKSDCAIILLSNVFSPAKD